MLATSSSLASARNVAAVFRPCCPRLCHPGKGRASYSCFRTYAQADGSPGWSPSYRETETAEEAYQRRLRESQEVEDRVQYVYAEGDFDIALAKAGDKLVVLEVQSDSVCESGIEEAELQWRADQRLQLQRCKDIKHVFQRTARNSPDVMFLSLVADAEESGSLCDRLGIEVLPTVQFWKHGKKIWEAKGFQNMESDLGEGVLFYGDTAGGDVKPSSFVAEINSKTQLEQFVNSQPENMLVVLDVSLTTATPCVHIYPAVLALARSFQGYAAFGRLMGDENEDAWHLMQELQVNEVPAFLFYRNGREVMRHAGASRADLIGKILEVQAAEGIAPPPPPPRASVPRKKPVRRNAWR